MDPLANTFHFLCTYNHPFSNLYPISLQIDGKAYASVEHFYASSKFSDPNIAEKIRLAPTINEAHLWGQGYSHALKSNWMQIRDAVMLQAMQAKFEQYPALAKQLLETGTLPIIQIDSDRYWGCYVNEKNELEGTNRGGQLLEQVRSTLKNNTK